MVYDPQTGSTTTQIGKKVRTKGGDLIHPIAGMGIDYSPRAAPGSNFRDYPSLGRDPVSKLADVRRSVRGAGDRFRRRFPFSGRSRRRGYGASNPKLLSYRRFTSKWMSPPGGRGLLQPNPSYMGGAGRFDPYEAASRGFGRNAPSRARGT